MTLIKWWRPQSLFVRTLLILCIPTVLVQLVTGFVFYERHWDTLARRMSGALGGEIALVAELLPMATAQQQHHILSAASATTRAEFKLLPLESMMLPLVRVGNEPFRALLSNELRQRLNLPFSVEFPQHSSMVRVTVQLDNGFLQVLANRNRLFSYTTNLVMWWMVGSSIVLFGIAIVFLRNQIRPIRKLAIAAEALGKGQDSDDLKPTGAIEVRQATSAFLLMRERIKRQIQQRTEMLAGISHDLRTPLTRMKLELALLPPNPDIEAMQHDVEEMRQMVDSYLAFARGDSEESNSEFDLLALIQEVHQDSARQGYIIGLKGALGPYTGRRAALKRCVQNLVENACRYGQGVAIDLETGKQKYKIHIDDNGPGIPENLYDEVFRPFRRLDESRNADTGGVGLGLSIARDIARSHGGDIVLSKSPMGGLRATLALPI